MNYPCVLAVYENVKRLKLQCINIEIGKVYLRNAYCVLMTEARQGLIVFISHGDNLERTRGPLQQHI